MDLPLPADFLPMEAQAVATVPRGPGWQYEPKWDGFRCLALRDGDAVTLRSKSGTPLNRYFPDLVDAVRRVSARRFGLDGEIVIPVDGGLSFEELQLRLHPAASRVQKLAAAHPALLLVFDLLVDADGAPLAALPLAQRRQRLEAFAARHLADAPALRLSPATADGAVAARWFRNRSGALDGVIAKRLDAPYDPGGRHAVQKVKPVRTADCVVGGFRYASAKREVGSLLLGLYDAKGLLHHVGFTATIPRAERPALTRTLERLVAPPGFTGDAPGGPSRWSTERTGEWEPLKPKLVVEVRYDHVTGGRFRHGTTLVRWRPDKAPRQCTCDQLDAPRGSALQLLGGPATVRRRRRVTSKRGKR
ncbi:MAG: ATP-dependent DNA ligase [Alphaproteobacteria bacterium]|nr:ATP-dependent DNA ligase [Alphaproteobacteria bacterium]